MPSIRQMNVSYVLFIALAASLGGLLFGYDTAVISGAIGFLRIKFELTPAQMGWAAASALVGSILGCMIAGVLSDAIGRKKVLILAAMLFAVSAIGSGLAQTIDVFVWYRILGGIGVGIASMITPMFISEIAPANIRGRLVSFYQFAIVFGIFIIYFVNYFIARQGSEIWNVESGWRWMFASEAIPAVIFLGFLIVIPESPRWLIAKQRIEKARGILQRIFGAQAESQLADIQSTVGREAGSWKMLLQPRVLKIVLIGVVLAVLQQAVGINVILYYAPEIFKTLGSDVNAALLQTIVIGVFNMGFTIVAMVKVDQLGRRPLLLVGSLGMAVCLLTIGLLAFFQITSIFSLILILGYISFFALSVGPVVWIILSEIFPTSIRGRAMSIATVFLWATNYLISQTFPIIDENPWLVERFHHGFSFWLYAAMCILMFLFVLKFIPETKGKTLEEIERDLNLLK